MDNGAKKRETLPVVRGTKEAELAPARRQVVALRVVGTGCEVPLPADVRRFAIGSDPTNHLVLDDRFVSNFHCLLERIPQGGLVLRDRHSRNGTYLNGLRVVESELQPGARIVLGGTALALVGEDRASSPQPTMDRLIGEAPVFRAAIDMTMRAARTSSPILLLGETGTGKELFAKLVHEVSGRACGPFVALNCGAIPGELVESVLFGHERGAFTGANDRRAGVFEQADGGTLFLDEIGELPIRQQPTLLRVLETGRVRRVGGELEQPVDVRIVSATHTDVRAAVSAGKMRIDLYHRLGVMEIRLPALRARPGDVAVLAHTFLAEAIAEHGPRTIPAAVMDELERYAWPGNVRELRNAVHRAAALSDGELRVGDLLPAIATGVTGWIEPRRMSRAARERVAVLDGLGVDDIMKTILESALRRHGSLRKAAKALGMSKSTLHDRARDLGLTWMSDEEQQLRKTRGEK